jgi:hypothetical protein
VPPATHRTRKTRPSNANQDDLLDPAVPFIGDDSSSQPVGSERTNADDPQPELMATEAQTVPIADLLIGASQGSMRPPLVAHGRTHGPREEARPA